MKTTTKLQQPPKASSGRMTTQAEPKKEKVVKGDTALPEYRPVLFIDNSNGAEFIISSTVRTTETAKAKSDKKEYPMYGLEISSSSHPFYTGKEKVLDTAGRVEKFKSRVAAAKVKKGKK
jgi:large subunit ribosomal protein L31